MEKSSNILVSRETLSTDTFLSLFGSDSYVNRFFELLPRKRLIAYNTNNISYLLFLVSLLIRKKYFPVVLFDKESDAELFLGDLRGLNRGNGIKWIPSFGQSSDLFASRAFENHLSDFLSSFYSGGSQALVSGPDILDYPVRDRSDYENSVLSICVGSEPGFSRFCDSLISLGYERTSGVEFVGEFCIRGGIVDVYPYGETYPYRVEFFGDSVESI